MAVTTTKDRSWGDVEQQVGTAPAIDQIFRHLPVKDTQLARAFGDNNVADFAETFLHYLTMSAIEDTYNEATCQYENFGQIMTSIKQLEPEFTEALRQQMPEEEARMIMNHDYGSDDQDLDGKIRSLLASIEPKIASIILHLHPHPQPSKTPLWVPGTISLEYLRSYTHDALERVLEEARHQASRSPKPAQKQSQESEERNERELRGFFDALKNGAKFGVKVLPHILNTVVPAVRKAIREAQKTREFPHADDEDGDKQTALLVANFVQRSPAMSEAIAQAVSSPEFRAKIDSEENPKTRGFETAGQQKERFWGELVSLLAPVVTDHVLPIISNAISGKSRFLKTSYEERADEEVVKVAKGHIDTALKDRGPIGGFIGGFIGGLILPF